MIIYVNDIELNKDKFTYDELMLIWFNLSKPFIVFENILKKITPIT